MLPFNIASYALLAHILASICDLPVGKLVFNGGNTHIYNNHIELSKMIIEREPLSSCELVMPKISSLEQVKDLKVSDFVLVNYNSHGPVKAPMAV